MKSAFTIVELLVVITIIVVLLALLAPAMDQAIYQAELAVCGATQRAVASSVVVYAMDHNRHYPYRKAARDFQTGWQPPQIYNGNPFIAALTSGSNDEVHDDRILFRTFLSLNKHLNDPLTGWVDLEDVDVDSNAYVPFELWFGFTHQREKGMFKLGNRWTYTDRGFDRKFSVLLSDRVVGRQSNGDVHNPHPDKSDIMFNEVTQNEEWVIGAGVGTKMVVSLWVGLGQTRGPVDNNFAYEDGSVRRVNDIPYQDPDMAWVPDWNNSFGNGWRVLLPTE